MVPNLVFKKSLSFFSSKALQGLVMASWPLPGHTGTIGTLVLQGQK